MVHLSLTCYFFTYKRNYHLKFSTWPPFMNFVLESLFGGAAQSNELLTEDESILIVDDALEVVTLLQDFLVHEGLAVASAYNAAAMQQKLQENNIALLLLDLGLPDGNGLELLPDLLAHHSHLAVIIVTAVNDLDTALYCMRKGADDYITKPVNLSELLASVHKVLKKRRLVINNRHYQRALEQARFRLNFSHELSLKMNTAFLSMVELDEILQTVLIGITADEGLQFNRAFLALFDDPGDVLQGRIAIGPASREKGGNIWQNIRELDLDLHDLLSCSNILVSDEEVNRIVRALRVDSQDHEHILIRAVQTRKSILVDHGQCEHPVPVELMGLLQEDSFVIVPLFSPTRPLGVIIADHFISGKAITADRIQALESFASQASLAIEHCHLYMDMERKLHELEAVTHELEKKKDLLIEAERYSAVGHVAAQLAHSIRNPITSIGGTARLLARKTGDPEWLKFLNMMKAESEKIERILEDLFSFVETVQPKFAMVPLQSVIEKSLILHSQALKSNEILAFSFFPEEDYRLLMDEELMQKVFVHLIRNSIEAMPFGGELHVTVKALGDEIEIVIADNGEGITELNLEQVADPFYTTKTVGTGIGLTFVKRIVEDHRGNLRILSIAGEGTRAVVTLPR